MQNLNRRKVDFNRIELLVLDVDGVLTDGIMIVNADGSESKFFNALDGHGIRLWRRAGLKVAFLSGRESGPTVKRAQQLEVDFCLQNYLDKLPELVRLVEDLNLKSEQVAYIGDDLPDIPPMRYAGFAVAVANAVDEVKQHADYVTDSTGGKGAVREVIEYILKRNGKWLQIMSRYLQ